MTSLRSCSICSSFCLSFFLSNKAQYSIKSIELSEYSFSKTFITDQEDITTHIKSNRDTFITVCIYGLCNSNNDFGSTLTDVPYRLLSSRFEPQATRAL